MGASSFWYQAGVNAAGPLVTAVVGLLIVGLAVNRYTSASQDRKMDNELRYGLISEITEAASTLYHHIAMYDTITRPAGTTGNNFAVRTVKGGDNRYHTGLSVEQLADSSIVDAAYHIHLKTTARLIFVSPLRQHRASRKISRQMDRVFKQAQSDGFDYQQQVDPPVVSG